MKKEVGLWIDHKRAVIVAVSGETEDITEIISNMEKRVRYSGVAQQVPGEDQRDRQYMFHLSRYYDRVIAQVRDAKSILIMGPGEAKREFEKQLKSEKYGGKIVGVETVDKMTDRQIAAKVRQQYMTAV